MFQCYAYENISIFRYSRKQVSQIFQTLCIALSRARPKTANIHIVKPWVCSYYLQERLYPGLYIGFYTGHHIQHE